MEISMLIEIIDIKTYKTYNHRVILIDSQRLLTFPSLKNISKCKQNMTNFNYLSCKMKSL